MNIPRKFLSLCLIAIIIAACGNRDRASAPVSPVTFAVFGNTGMVTDGGLAFSSIAGALNLQGVDFSIDLGNRLPSGISSSGLDALWDAVDADMEKLVSPVFPVVGMSDVFDSRSDERYCERYGPSWYSFNRGGMVFIVLCTADKSYSRGFGERPRIGDEQLAWLMECVRKAGNSPIILIMHHPLWRDDPGLWHDRLLPALRPGNVILAVSCAKDGLMDWGTMDGIRAVSSGCTGPMEEKGMGLFPHSLLITVNGRDISFRMLSSEGSIQNGIPVTAEDWGKAEQLALSMQPPVLKSESSWKIGDTFDLKLLNPFPYPVTGEIAFQVFDNTAWTIHPAQIPVLLEPNMSRTYHVDVRGNPPELGPQPTFRTSLKVGEMDMDVRSGSFLVQIPAPRTGTTVPISARVASTVSCNFNGSSVRIPVDIQGPDTCGRLVIYRTESVEVPACIHISGLRYFRPGVNEFVWNGHDMEGNPVTQGPLAYMVVVYNKKAPVTWVADGPSDAAGTFTVERELSGLVGKTVRVGSIAGFRIGKTLGDPKAEEGDTLWELLDGFAPTGYASDGDRRLFISTRAGVACAYTTGGKPRMDTSFGESGFLRLSEYRCMAVGTPAYGGGHLYIGIGGGMGKGPRLLAADGESGRILSVIDLEEYYGRSKEPPALAADDCGVYVGHPEGDIILHCSHEGDIVWMNEPGDNIGDRDVDGRSHVYGIGVDPFGLAYVTSPGTSARCGVIGPDGRGLFRVILVQLPGLRVSSVVPMIEGKPSDGLYFVTRGGDRPYVFHIPYTVCPGQLEKGAGGKR